MFGFTKKQKVFLINKIDEINRDSEILGLTREKYMEKKVEEKIYKINKEEEIKWLQRSNEKDLLEGDALTSYFISRASNREEEEQNYLS